jgi:hypothetical protein
MTMRSRDETVDYRLTGGEKVFLRRRADDVVRDVESGKLSPEDLADIGRLLEIHADEFEQAKNQPWFKKAWSLVSGERGRLVDQSIANLGKVQIAVIKILDELLQTNMQVKEDILNILDRMNTIETDIHQLKHFLLQFNAKNQERYQELRRDLRTTRGSVRLLLLTSVGVLLTIALAAIMPGLIESHARKIAAGSAALATILLARTGYSYWAERQSTPIDVHGGEVDDRQLPEDEDFRRTEAFLLEDSRRDQRIFKVGGEISNLKDYFTLSTEEQRLLFSIQHYLVRKDAKGNSRKKRRWLRRWEESIEESLEGTIVTDTEILFQGLDEVASSRLPVPKVGTLLLEARLFEPYFALSGDEEAFTDEYDEDAHVTNVQRVAYELDFDLASLKSAKQIYDHAFEEIPPSNLGKKLLVGATAAVLLAVTGGALAPVIGGAIGSAFGLSGAAAVSSGLAFLGGGALAAGGLGMAGGTAVLIGGGAILGASAGSGLASLLSKDKTLTLRELAKLEAITKEYLSDLPESEGVILAVVDQVQTTQRSLENEAESLGWREAREAKKAAEYCGRFIDRIQQLEHT